MSNTAIPALVVGTGFGCSTHVPALRAAGFQVAGLVGTNPERLAQRAEKAGIDRTFTDLAEAIAKTGARAVAIATPPSTHAALTLTAIEHGCHVLCEKPFAFDTGEAQTMLDAAEKAGICHLVAHEFRWAPDRALFGRAIAEGLIGEPRFLVVDQFFALYADPAKPVPAWWFQKASGGGWLGAGGSHVFDQVRAWLGDFDTLSASLFLVADRPAADVDDSFSLRFRMKSGVEGSMQQSSGAWGPGLAVWRCVGTKGTVWMEGGKVFVADRQGTRELPFPAELVPAGAADPANFVLAPFTRLCEVLRAGVEGQEVRSPVPIPTFHDGVACMRVLDAIHASAAQGGALTNVG